jgi:HEAT repeat protein
VGEEEIRFTVVQIVGLIKGRRANGLLIQALGDGHHQIARHAMESLHGKVEAADLPQLAAYVTHKDADLRFYLVQVAARVGGPVARKMMFRFLADPLAEVREKAATVLLNDPTESVVAGVLRLSVSAKSAEVRGICKRLLESLQPEDLLGALVSCLKDRDPAVRKVAIEELHKKRKERFNFLPGDPSILRNEAADRWLEWYWRMKNPEGNLDDIVADLAKTNPTVRWRAATSLAGLRTRRVLKALLSAVETETVPWVRAELFLALQKTTGESFGFAKGLSKEETDRVVEKWKAWWKKNQEYY